MRKRIRPPPLLRDRTGGGRMAMDMTAMRTAMPLLTCSRITERAAVGDRRVHLHPAVDRARVHDDGVRLGEFEAFLGEAVELEILVFAGQQGPAHALALQAQHDDHVDVPHPFAQVVADPHAQGFGLGRDQGARARSTRTSATPRVLRAGIWERATRECRMSPTMATRRLSKSPLWRRMVNMSSIAWVGWAWRPSPALMTLTCGRGVLGDEMRGAAVGVAHHEHVARASPPDCAGYRAGSRPWLVEEAAMLMLSTSADKPLGGQFEGGAGAGAGLEKQIDDGFAAQQRHFFDRLFGNAGK